MKYNKPKSILIILLIIVLFSGVAYAETALLPGDIKLSLSAGINAKSGKVKNIDGVYAVSQGSSFYQTYNIVNSSNYAGSIEVAIYEKITSENGSIISDWKTLKTTLAQGLSAAVTGSTVNMDITYGKSVTFSYKLMFKVNDEWIEYSSASSSVKLYSPQFSVSYTTDADPVGISDFPVYFGGKITLKSGMRVNKVKIFDSVYGLLQEIGDLKENENKRFQKDVIVSAGPVNSYIIIEYVDLMSGKTERTELPTVKVTGKIIDPPIESKLSLTTSLSKTHIKTPENLDVTFDFKNNTQYDIITAFAYQLNEEGKAIGEPIADMGAVLKGKDSMVTKNIYIEPDKTYIFAVYAYVEDSSTPFKTTAEFTLSSVPPSLEIRRSIDTDKLPFYTDAAVEYTVKNISEHDVKDVVISDGILGQIYKTDNIKSNEEVTFTAAGKFYDDFVSEPEVSLIIEDGKNTPHTFKLTKQIFEVQRKNEPSIMMLTENIDSKNKENISFDVILLNDGNTDFVDLELIDKRNGALLDTFSLLSTTDKQTAQIKDQNYEDDKEIILSIKCRTADGKEMVFDFDPVKLTNPVITIIIVSAVFVLLAALILFIKLRKKITRY